MKANYKLEMQNSEVFLTLIMLTTVCWDVTACGLVQYYHLLEKCTPSLSSILEMETGGFYKMVVNFYQFTQCCTPVDSYLQCVWFEAVSSTAQDTTPPHITMGNCTIGYKQFLMLCRMNALKSFGISGLCIQWHSITTQKIWQNLQPSRHKESQL
jgi:hypothetical protein